MEGGRGTEDGGRKTEDGGPETEDGGGGGRRTGDGGRKEAKLFVEFLENPMVKYLIDPHSCFDQAI